MSGFTGSRIDHLNIAVGDLGRACAFYELVLATLGITRLIDVPADPDADQLPMVAFGVHPKPFFWLVANGTVGTGMHLAFTAADRATVRTFHDAAVRHGAVSHLAPAVHPEYHADYYGAFIADPLGIDLEAVCHDPV